MRPTHVQKQSTIHRCLDWSRRNPKDAGFVVAVAGFIVLGFILRSNGFWFHPIGLWGDEAHQAMRMTRLSIGEMVMRPLGFTGFTKLCVTWFGYDERTLRLLSYLTSVAMLLVAPFVGRYAFERRFTAALLVALVALHPALIDYAKEFKPYATETFVHLGLVALLLAYRKKRTRVLLYGLAVAAPIGFLFAYNTIFLYPALFLLWGIDVVQTRQYPRLWAIVPSAVLCLAAPALLYVVAWSSLDKGEEENFWANKYNSFYVAEGDNATEGTRVDWVAKRYASVVAIPAMERDSWGSRWMERKTRHSIEDAWYYFWVGLHLAGIVSLAHRRRFHLLTLWLLPLLVALGFNQIGRWPFSAFRVNLFTLAYTLPLACAGFDGLLGNRRRWVELSTRAAVVFVLWLPYALFGFGWHEDKDYWTTSTEMVETMARMRKVRERTLQRRPDAPPETILLDSYACGPMRYYTQLDAKTLRKHGEFFRENFELRCTGRGMVKRARKQKEPFWVILAQGRWANDDTATELAELGKFLVDVRPIRVQRVLRIRPTKKRKKSKKHRGSRSKKD